AVAWTGTALGSDGRTEDTHPTRSTKGRVMATSTLYLPTQPSAAREQLAWDCQEVTCLCHFASGCPSSIAASRARSSGERPSRAAARAVIVSGCSAFGPLVQTGVQTSSADDVVPAVSTGCGDGLQVSHP